MALTVTARASRPAGQLAREVQDHDFTQRSFFDLHRLHPQKN